MIGIDVLHGFEQELIVEAVDGNLVIRDLLVKDYPIILRLVDREGGLPMISEHVSGTVTSEAPTELLPHTLYYLSNDGISRRENSTLLLPVYRMEHDGKTLTRLTSEPNGVESQDVSVVIRNENFTLMNEALQAPDASFVIVASAPSRDWRDIGVLELYDTDGQKSPVWLAPFGSQMKWGP